jgi:primosomal protein N' (replication factor Y)
VLATVPDDPALVVATPGAEPVAAGGYAAALLLDGWAMLSRPDLRVDEEALRRWLGAAALVRPAGAGGAVVIVADAETPAVQALVRWDPATFAERELAERAALHLPPAAAVASLTGSAPALDQFLAAAQLPEQAEVLGPVAVTSRTPGDDDAQRLAVLSCEARGRLAEHPHPRIGRARELLLELTERLEKETAELIQYLNNEVVPAARVHSSKALRTASEKLAAFANYLDETKSSR